MLGAVEEVSLQSNSASFQCLLCEREGRAPDYTRKRGVDQTFILALENAPAWVHDRAALWNAAEASSYK